MLGEMLKDDGKDLFDDDYVLSAEEKELPDGNINDFDILEPQVREVEEVVEPVVIDQVVEPVVIDQE